MTARDSEDDLVSCEECGRKGLPGRIERIRCPHLGFVSALKIYRGP